MTKKIKFHLEKVYNNYKRVLLLLKIFCGMAVLLIPLNVILSLYIFNRPDDANLRLRFVVGGIIGVVFFLMPFIIKKYTLKKEMIRLYPKNFLVGFAFTLFTLCAAIFFVIVNIYVLVQLIRSLNLNPILS